MNDRKEKFAELMAQLEQERDELKVKLGLAKLEAREEWQELEKKMEALRARMGVIGDEAREASGDVGAALNVLIKEIKEGLARIRKVM